MQICQSLRSDTSPLEAESPRQIRDYMPWWKLNTILHLSWLFKWQEMGVSYKSETMDLQERSIWQHFKFRLMTQPIFGMHSNGCESVLGEHVQRCHMCHLPQSIQNLSPDIVIHCLWTAPMWLLCWNLVPVVISCFTPMLCRPWCKSNWV